jgi:hypothetical protein
VEGELIVSGRLRLEAHRGHIPQAARPEAVRGRPDRVRLALPVSRRFVRCYPAARKGDHAPLLELDSRASTRPHGTTDRTYGSPASRMPGNGRMRDQCVTRPKPNRVLVAEVVPLSQSISIDARVFCSAGRFPTTVLVLVLMMSPLSPTYTYRPERSFNRKPSFTQAL